MLRSFNAKNIVKIPKMNRKEIRNNSNNEVAKMTGTKANHSWNNIEQEVMNKSMKKTHELKETALNKQNTFNVVMRKRAQQKKKI